MAEEIADEAVEPSGIGNRLSALGIDDDPHDRGVDFRTRPEDGRRKAADDLRVGLGADPDRQRVVAGVAGMGRHPLRHLALHRDGGRRERPGEGEQIRDHRRGNAIGEISDQPQDPPRRGRQRRIDGRQERRGHGVLGGERVPLHELDVVGFDEAVAGQLGEPGIDLGGDHAARHRRQAFGEHAGAAPHLEDDIRRTDPRLTDDEIDEIQVDEEVLTARGVDSEPDLLEEPLQIRRRLAGRPGEGGLTFRGRLSQRRSLDGIASLPARRAGGPSRRSSLGTEPWLAGRESCRRPRPPRLGACPVTAGPLQPPLRDSLGPAASPVT